MSRVGFARALYDYVSDRQEDVSLAAGDIVQVLGELNSDWLKGRNHNKVGYFPRSYIEPLRLPSVSASQRLFLAVKPFIGQVQGDLSFNTGRPTLLLLQVIVHRWAYTTIATSYCTVALWTSAGGSQFQHTGRPYCAKFLGLVN